MKYEFVFYCDKERAIKEVLYNLKKKPFYLCENKTIYGKRWGNFVDLIHGTEVNHNLRTIFTMYFKEIEPGKTVAKGVFRYRWIDMVIFAALVIIFGLPIIFNFGNVEKNDMIVTLLMALIIVGINAFSIFIERKNRSRIIEHIKTHQRIINGDM